MLTPMSYGKEGLALTEHFEAADGPNTISYLDRYAKVWTIGYGHTGPDVGPDTVWTVAQCVSALLKDLAVGVAVVNKFVIPQLNQDQFDACVDFTFNTGQGSFEESTLLKDINAGDMEDADNEFAKWIYSGHNVVPGLVRRRAAEKQLFSTPC